MRSGTLQSPPAFVEDAIDLAQLRLGAEVLAASDEFFAAKERMLQEGPAVFVPGKYDEHGKWMDGWETRRRRGPGHDWAVVRLAVPGILHGVDLDTSHFTGNYPQAASIEACLSEADPAFETAWREILPPTPLGPDAHHYLALRSDAVWSHLRLNIHPDGGIARFRVYGTPYRDWRRLAPEEEVDLAATLNGGKAIAWNDAHYGHPDNILAPGRGLTMADGWETRRRREPGHDWAIIRLGHPGTITCIVVDTAHFKGNFPESCSIQAAAFTNVEKSSAAMVAAASMFWNELLSVQKLEADAIHEFGADVIAPLGPVSHIRLNIIPDGGVSRLRLFGRRAEA